MKFPRWVMDPTLSEAQRQSNKIKFALYTAKLQLSDDIGLTPLARAIGCTNQGLYSAIERGYLTPMMALRIENLVGADIVPKELLCPDFLKEV